MQGRLRYKPDDSRDSGDEAALVPSAQQGDHAATTAASLPGAGAAARRGGCGPGGMSRTGPTESDFTAARSAAGSSSEAAPELACRDSKTAPPLNRQLTRGNTFRRMSISVGAESGETAAEFERIRRKSVALATTRVVKRALMPDHILEVAIEQASVAIVRGGWDNEIAARIKKTMDVQYPSRSRGHWHCIVGPDFGSYITHEQNHFVYFYLPRFLSPVEVAEQKREARKLEEEKLLSKERTVPRDVAAVDRGPFAQTAIGVPLGTDKRMVGILLWRT